MKTFTACNGELGEIRSHDDRVWFVKCKLLFEMVTCKTNDPILLMMTVTMSKGEYLID